MALKSALINVMAAAARKAARGLVRDFGEVENLQVSKKGPADFVSAADIRAEEVLRRELTKARPDYGFRLEEGGDVAPRDGQNIWLVDPLDGTTNFLHGVPHFAISIALEHNKELIAGIVYDPVKNEMFWAEKGQGAYCNEHRLRVSARSRMNEALIATGIPFKSHQDPKRFLHELEAVMREVAGVRRFGAAALDLAYVAAGRCDAFWERGLSPWDIGAGIVLVREAGGMVTDIDGSDKMIESGNIIAANDHLHVALGVLLRDAVEA
jgi:myo-inositol-1(or 4)-monophosphatase